MENVLLNDERRSVSTEPQDEKSQNLGRNQSTEEINSTRNLRGSIILAQGAQHMTADVSPMDSLSSLHGQSIVINPKISSTPDMQAKYAHVQQ